MTLHCMLDLETLGTKPGCVVLSIGAQIFDPETGGLGSVFYRNVAVEGQVNLGLVKNPSTEAWWDAQSAAAKARLHNPMPEPCDKVAKAFNAFLRAHGVTNVWGHGAGFDQPILRALYAALGMGFAAPFYDDRDTRTIFALSGVIVNRGLGVHHDALTDATRQAEAVCEAYAELGLTTHGWFDRIQMKLNKRASGSYYSHRYNRT